MDFCFWRALGKVEILDEDERELTALDEELITLLIEELLLNSDELLLISEELLREEIVADDELELLEVEFVERDDELKILDEEFSLLCKLDCEELLLDNCEFELLCTSEDTLDELFDEAGEIEELDDVLDTATKLEEEILDEISLTDEEAITIIEDVCEEIEEAFEEESALLLNAESCELIDEASMEFSDD